MRLDRVAPATLLLAVRRASHDLLRDIGGVRCAGGGMPARRASFPGYRLSTGGHPDMSAVLPEKNLDVQQSGRAPRNRHPRRRLPLKLAAAAIGVAVVVPLAGRTFDLLPSWDNPFAQEVVDRSTPPLMLALADLEEYHAATGTFQVVIDQERDTPYLPSVLSGERTSFLATGSVDASVDFGQLGAQAVETSEDRRSVTISLPAARLGEASVDPGNSRVLDRDRGVFDRIGGMFEDDPSNEGEFYVLAEQRLEGAAAQSDLLARGEENTRDMLTALATSMGFGQVTVTFATAPDTAG
jgi:hypothetical protein